MKEATILIPDHACGLTLSHNTHKNYYETAEKYLRDDIDQGSKIPDLDYATAADRTAMIDTNEVWDLHWYPSTPIGFHHFGAPTLERLMQRLKETTK